MTEKPRSVTVGDSRWSSSLSSTESMIYPIHTNAIDVSGLCHNWLFFLSEANDWSSCFSSLLKSYITLLQATKTSFYVVEQLILNNYDLQYTTRVIIIT